MSGPTPNVCVVVFDAARASNFSCYGHERETTPTTDDLAADGSVYRRAVSPSGVTFDSVTSLFSGLYPGEHQSGAATRVNTDVQLLAEYLSAHGYRTAAATSSPSTTPAFGFGRGFDRYHDVVHGYEGGMNVKEFFDRTKELSTARRYLRFLREAADRNVLSHVGNALRFKYGFRTGDDGGRAVTDRSAEFVRDSDRPWFLYVHYTETHMNSVDDLPYSLPGDRAFRYTDGEVDPSRLTTRTAEVEYDAETADTHERLYDAAISYLDELTGDLVDAIRETGEFEDTILVVTADHGECIGEHGFLGHGRLHEPILHVPLVVRGPGVPDRDVEERVNTVSLYRTVASVVGDPPDHVRGTDLLGPDPGEETTLVQDYSDTWEWSRHGGKRTGQNAVYRDEVKYVVTEEGEALYDLRADPGETEDLADDRPDLAEEMRAALRARLDEIDEADPGASAGEFDDSVESRLRDMGYLE
jgi:arylsulfatase A-like enzyme